MANSHVKPAGSSPAGPNKTAAPATSDEERRRASLQQSLWSRLNRASRELIYTSLQRAGGEPFGAPFEPGLATLTERMVRYFKQRSFFNFSSTERLQRRAQRNKFTRHGAAPYLGPYSNMPSLPQHLGWVGRFLRYLRAQRYFIFVLRPPPPENE